MDEYDVNDDDCDDDNGVCVNSPLWMMMVMMLVMMIMVCVTV